VIEVFVHDVSVKEISVRRVTLTMWRVILRRVSMERVSLKCDREGLSVKEMSVNGFSKGDTNIYLAMVGTRYFYRGSISLVRYLLFYGSISINRYFSEF
jgi:hypothetical protein